MSWILRLRNGIIQNRLEQGTEHIGVNAGEDLKLGTQRAGRQSAILTSMEERMLVLIETIHHRHIFQPGERAAVRAGVAFEQN